MKQTITRIWEGQPDVFVRLISLPLRLFSVFYGFATGLRNLLYDRGVLRTFSVSCPVISVGNVTVGGTGKTPMVIHLAKHFQQARLSPAVITRGYGGRSKEKLTIVSDGQKIMAGPETAGEEAVLLALSLPGVAVIVSPDRVRAARTAIDMFQADLIILDDAFQHRRIFRDLDIVLLDWRYPLGNGFLLPGGPMRESAAGLKRADVIVFTASAEVADTLLPEMPSPRGKEIFSSQGFDQAKPFFVAIRRPAGLFRLGSHELLSPAILANKKIGLFSGIGMPDGFKNTLESLGAVVEAHRIYPDHHSYRQRDIEELRNFFLEAQVDYIVTTEKDAVKLTPFSGCIEVHVLVINLEVIPVQAPQWERVLNKFTVKSTP